jgi:hypothetical protein
VVDPSTGTWYLRNEASPGAPDAGVFQFGAPGWIPVVGHWAYPNYGFFGRFPRNTGIGVVDPSTMTWYLRNEASTGAPDAGVKQFGAPGWLPVQNSWIATSASYPVVVDPGSMTWYLQNGQPPQFPYGGTGWRPVMGDWNGDGQVGVGAIDPSGVWHLKNFTDFFAPDLAPFAYGLGSWTPLVGHWLIAAPSGALRAAGTVQALPPVVNEPRATLGDPLAALAASGSVDPPATSAPGPSAPSAAFPQASVVADASAATEVHGVVPGVGDPVAASARARRARTAALDDLFTTGFAPSL